MSLSVFYYCICACLRRCRSFNPSLCRLSPFHLSYVAVSRPCRLSEFTPTGLRLLVQRASKLPVIVRLLLMK